MPPTNTATQWQPGKSANPGGRPRETVEIREVRRLALEKTERAMTILLGLMEGAEKDAVRLAAALAVLKIAGVRMDGEVTVNLPPPPPPTQHLPTAKLLAMKTSTTTRSPPSSGDEGN